MQTHVPVKSQSHSMFIAALFLIAKNGNNLTVYPLENGYTKHITTTLPPLYKGLLLSN